MSSLHKPILTYPLAVVVVLTAFACRALALPHGFELWVDEMVYTELGDTISQGHLPALEGIPFFLHPPGGFILEGAVIKAFGIHGDLMAQALQLRWLNVVLGALTAGTGFLLVRAVAGLGLSLCCAALLAFDPFVLRTNGRVFLETPAVLASLAGLLVLVTALARKERLSTRRAVFAGMLIGYGVFSKDALVMFAAVPVVAAMFWRHTMHRRDGLTVLVSATAPYLAYLAVVGADGLFNLWSADKISGTRRLIGLDQTTGFNAPGAPDLWSRLVDQVAHFGTSYLLLLVCPVAGLVAALSADRARRLIGLSALSMGLFGVFAILFGTLEEQYGYGVVVAGIAALGAAGAELRRPAALAAIALVVVTVVLGNRVIAEPDDGLVRVRDWVTANLPATARVGVTNNTAQWAFRDDPRFGVWPSAGTMLTHDANYILTQSLPTSQGYGYAKYSMIEWLERNAQPRFTFTGPTNGQTVLWYVPPANLRRGADAGAGS
ncbi:glycosyltransferase family 39 protein [Amycolatopsis sp. GM8]|uniref:ArnT family glycosyltransferase n=1 Tax=Amycolatopsis sp. GM8 TaxID=2896530 RepID=UPI001F4773BF|nr:hypothetical protein [Amycolatopsis sp. GM8]